MRSVVGICIGVFLLHLATSSGYAQPNQVTYQGELKTSGAPFSGTAAMKFAIVSGSTTLWSNDGTSIDGSQPLESASVDVSNGIFTIQLGAPPMVALTSVSLGPSPDAVLRVWVATGSGFEQLSDLTMSSAPFALQAGWTIHGSDLYHKGTIHVEYVGGYAAGIRLQGDLNDQHVDLGAGNDGAFVQAKAADFSGPGALLLNPTGGNVGIRTSTPTAPLHVLRVLGGEQNVAAARIQAIDGGVDDELLFMRKGTQGGQGDIQLIQGNANGSTVFSVSGTGHTTTKVLEITGGSDLAEPFEVAPHPASEPQPGMAVCIDPENPGRLRLATEPYDPTVAGIISGANGLKPGMVMRAEGVEHADGSHNVALSGRVWCWADASDAAIAPGDLLTTSGTPGHAMKATARERAYGTVIGKAMSGLASGTGLVLVLVALQ